MSVQREISFKFLSAAERIYQFSEGGCDLRCYERGRILSRIESGTRDASLDVDSALARRVMNMARIDFTSRETVEFAAQGGQPDALFELGLIYCSGRDGEVDLVEAHKWFNLAAIKGNEDAKRYRLELARDMSKGDIARAQKLAREWLASVH
jgi:TPR repeat protein